MSLIHKDKIEDVYIVGAARTPIGAMRGKLAHLNAASLGAIAISAAVADAGLSPEAVSEVVLGNVCSAGVGQGPARLAAATAGLPPAADCTTVNKVCSSGMKAVHLAAASIALGSAEVVVAGGFESMSNVPHYMYGAHTPDAVLVDGLKLDGLTDSMHGVSMVDCAGEEPTAA